MKFVRNLLGALGRPELAVLCEPGPGPHQQPVEQFLRETFRTRTRDEWVQYLSKIDVCFGELNTFPEALRDPHLNARGMILVDGLGRRHIGSPIRFAREPAKIDLHEPAMGEHGGQVLGRR
jgi:crotonobetainyl-CoA:carnitine CoA-transferase CaiB-like acyl-CoA transferase